MTYETIQNMILGYNIIILAFIGYVALQAHNQKTEEQESLETIRALEEDNATLERKCKRLANDAVWNYNEARHLREALDIKTREYITAQKIIEGASKNGKNIV